jgi:rRNA maturation RNase YbeY
MDWFDVTNAPFTVQASIEKILLDDPAFNTQKVRLHTNLRALLSAFADTAKVEGLLAVHGLAETFHSPELSWEFEWMLCTNETIQAWNTSYRQKTTPTDVLSFPTFEAEETLLAATQADKVAMLFFNQQKQMGGSLGTVVVSWDYACQAIQADASTTLEATIFEEKLQAYLLERFCHGCLHLLGIHHETQEQFERVLALQSLTLLKIN